MGEDLIQCVSYKSGDTLDGFLESNSDLFNTDWGRTSTPSHLGQ